MKIDAQLANQYIWWNDSSSSSSGAASFWDEDDTQGLGSMSSDLSVVKDQLDQLTASIAAKVSAANVQTDADEKTTAFAEELRTALEEKGIDLGEGVTLTLDDSGMVRVVGEHEDKEAIEEFFSSDEEWSEKYADVHLRNDLARKLAQAKQLGNTANNPYLKNLLAWEKTTVTVTPDGVTVGTA
ncbi:MAG: hypothetical protein H0S85_03120 [Desulfovibrionaceae bacterium]|jgi:Ribonuclease G/E|nr:hypothetical protein [Desulfovibrionaceae bacterium]